MSRPPSADERYARTFNLRISERMRDDVKQHAKQRRVSMNAVIVVAVEEYLKCVRSPSTNTTS